MGKGRGRAERQRRRGVWQRPGPSRKRQPQAMPAEGPGTTFLGQADLAPNAELFVCCLVVATDVRSCSGRLGVRRERGGVQHGKAAWREGRPGLVRELQRDRWGWASSTGEMGHLLPHHASEDNLRMSRDTRGQRGNAPTWAACLVSVLTGDFEFDCHGKSCAHRKAPCIIIYNGKELEAPTSIGPAPPLSVSDDPTSQVRPNP